MHALCMIMQIYDAQKLVDNVCTHTNVHALMYIFYTCILMSAYTYTCTHTHTWIKTMSHRGVNGANCCSMISLLGSVSFQVNSCCETDPLGLKSSTPPPPPPPHHLCLRALSVSLSELALSRSRAHLSRLTMALSRPSGSRELPLLTPLSSRAPMVYPQV